jgi:hypothetical protein
MTRDKNAAARAVINAARDYEQAYRDQAAARQQAAVTRDGRAAA